MGIAEQGTIRVERFEGQSWIGRIYFHKPFLAANARSQDITHRIIQIPSARIRRQLGNGTSSGNERYMGHGDSSLKNATKADVLHHSWRKKLVSLNDYMAAIVQDEIWVAMTR